MPSKWSRRRFIARLPAALLLTGPAASMLPVRALRALPAPRRDIEALILKRYYQAKLEMYRVVEDSIYAPGLEQDCSGLGALLRESSRMSKTTEIPTTELR